MQKQNPFFSELKMYRLLQKIAKNLNTLHPRKSSSNYPKLPEEPTTCCMSGCANCVWIEYANSVREILSDYDSNETIKVVLEKVQDPNMRAFLAMELKSKIIK